MRAAIMTCRFGRRDDRLPYLGNSSGSFATLAVD